MRSLFAFIKKDLLELLRSGHLFILLGIFSFLGILSPTITKFTPILLELLADELEMGGMVITDIAVNVTVSWGQFFKNISMGLIAFVLIESNIFTKEYKSGTLVLTLTKGLERYKVVIAKSSVLILLWSICYWLSFAITYVCNGILWDNATVQKLALAGMTWWMLGLLVICATVLFSAIANSNILVLCGAGGVFLAIYLMGLLPKIGKYSPSMLMNTANIYMGIYSADIYTLPFVISAVICIVFIITAIPIFNKKHL